ncbi:MAG: hypothetical protein WBP29_00040, partial [Candidatus Zixiibacteriota bacterium]
MSTETSLQDRVKQLLSQLDQTDALKELIWGLLNYERVNLPLARKGWDDAQSGLLFEDPLLFAAGGEKQAFHVIYSRLASD